MPRRLIVILAIGAIWLIWGLLDGPAARQRRGAEEVRAFQSQLMPKLAADPRFASVAIGMTTQPALRVYGEVADEQALRDLNAQLAAPPGVLFRISVDVKVASTRATHPVL